MKTDNNFPRLLESFFMDRLIQQRRASSHTIASYRDTFRLLLEFAQQHLKKAPSTLSLQDLDTPFIGSFLDHLEKDRGISPRSRNVRLAAIRSFFKYVSFHEPNYSALTQRVLAMPNKRYKRKSVEYLTRPEIEALLSVPNRKTWIGRRDWTLILFALQTGLRLSELTGLCCQDVVLTSGAHVRCLGKGRKERCTPLCKKTVAALRAWLGEYTGGPSDPLFPSTKGKQLSSDGVQYIVAKHVAVAQNQCPSLKKKRVSPHVLRHSVAMELLQNGVDRTVIALWLGHESIETTQMYLHANLKLKEQALSKVAPPNVQVGRYRPDDQLLAFLNSL